MVEFALLHFVFLWCIYTTRSALCHLVSYFNEHIIYVLTILDKYELLMLLQTSLKRKKYLIWVDDWLIYSYHTFFFLTSYAILLIYGFSHFLNLLMALHLMNCSCTKIGVFLFFNLEKEMKKWRDGWRVRTRGKKRKGIIWKSGSRQSHSNTLRVSLPYKGYQ